MRVRPDFDLGDALIVLVVKGVAATSTKGPRQDKLFLFSTTRLGWLAGGSIGFFLKVTSLFDRFFMRFRGGSLLGG